MPEFGRANPEYRSIRRRKAINAAHMAPRTRHPDVFSRVDVGGVEGGLREGEWHGRSEADWDVSVVAFRRNVLRVTYVPRDVDVTVPTYALPEGSAADGTLALEDDEDALTFGVEGGRMVLAKADGSFAVSLPDGQELLHMRTAPRITRSIMAGLVDVGVSFEIDPGDAFHGLGDKPGQLDMRGRRHKLWCTDSFGYDQKSDAIYKAIPFTLLERGDRRIGLFFNNTYKSTFDFGATDTEVFGYHANGGALDIFMIFGDDPAQICADYVKLTGTPPLPPMWALGYQQCRWSYYPEARVREVVRGFREREIPCDAIYLDIDYMEEYKCFTVSERLFPDLGGMIADFREVDMRTVVMIDPGIAAEKGYPVYEDGTERDVWCKRPSGQVMRGPVWPEECVFPDYTKAEVRDWWGRLYEELYVTQGVSGFWNDMNEPAVFKVNAATFPNDVMHDMDGHPATHARAHNVYGLKMTEASDAGLRALKPDERPFLLTRATFSGGQRYAATWTGDNSATWRHLQIANHQVIRLSLCGFSLSGSDIGGFNQDPDGELYTRWIQLAIWHPVMRTHSMGNNQDGATQTDQEAVARAAESDRRDQEPWSYGEPWTGHCREGINWRYRLLPSIYTAIEASHRAGTPALVPSYMEDPNDRRLVDKHAFRFGEHLFVDPVVRQGQSTKQAYLPKGVWYALQSGERFEGARRYTIQTPMELIPCWVRGGAVLQLDPVRQSTGQPYPSAPELHVYHAEGRTESALYLDAGEGFAHESDGYRRVAFTYEGAVGRSTVTASSEGAYVPPFSSYELVWHGKGEGTWTLSVDGEEVETRPEGKTYRATIPAAFGELRMVRG